MNFLQRSANILVYEWRRALTKKKIYVLVILTLVLQIGVFALVKYFFTNHPPGVTFIGPPLEELRGTMWLLGVLGPQGLFIPFIAIIAAGGSISEEYEYGTVDILLSKPITRIEYVTGKYLGSLSFLSLVIALITGLGVVLAPRVIRIAGVPPARSSRLFGPRHVMMLQLSDSLQKNKFCAPEIFTDF